MSPQPPEPQPPPPLDPDASLHPWEALPDSERQRIRSYLKDTLDMDLPPDEELFASVQVVEGPPPETDPWPEGMERREPVPAKEWQRRRRPAQAKKTEKRRRRT